MADAQIAIIDGDQTQVVLAPGENPAIVSSIPGPQGPAGAGVPLGGTANQVLFKQSGTNYDTAWGPITSAMIGDLEIVNADVSASAAIAGTKISPNFGSQTIQTTGVFSHALGTAGAPTITFTGDTNTGLYSPGADQLALSTNGTGRLFINASGLIGIGNSNPVNLLDVEGVTPILRVLANSNTASTINLQSRAGATTVGLADIQCSNVGNLIFSTGTTSTTERLRITSAGLVGIGTSSPRTSLDLGTVDSVVTIGPANASQGLRLGLSRRLNFGDGLIGKNLAGSPGSDNYITPGSGFGYSGIEMRFGGDTIIYASNASTTAGASVSPPARLIVKSDTGNVGIGTQSPGVPLSVKTAGGDSAAIHVIARTAGSQSIVFRDSNDTANTAILYQDTNVLSLANVQNAPLSFATNNTERARITSSGQLLVGTSSARSNFFNVSSVAPGFQLEGTGAEGRNASIVSSSSTGSSTASLILAHQKSGTVGGNTKLDSGDIAGRLSFQGSDGNEFVEAAFIQAEIDGTTGANDMPGRLVFSTTADGAASPTERMRIDSSGRVGIGTTSPATELHVANAGGNAEIRIGNSQTFDHSRIFTTTDDLTISNQRSANLILRTAATERARIDSSGRLLVGTSSSAQNATVVLKGNSSTDPQAILFFESETTNPTANAALGVINFADSAENRGAQIAALSDGNWAAGSYPGRLVFSTTSDASASPTERMRINAAGGFKFSDTGTYTTATDAQAEFRQSTNVVGLSVRSTNASFTSNVLLLRADRNASGGEYNFISAGVTGVDTRFIVANDGDVTNTNNAYGAISDIKLKENIVDANSQWDDIKALQVRNYNFKEGQTHTQIGLVAQEVELVSPGLVSESPDRDEDGNDLGTTTKSVNYSVLYMKAVKALQEAMERIELLEARLDAANI